MCFVLVWMVFLKKVRDSSNRTFSENVSYSFIEIFLPV